MKPTILLINALLLTSLATLRADEKLPSPIASLIKQNCFDCHNAETKEGKLDLTAMTFDIADPKGMERWVQVFDRVDKKEMPPDAEAMTSDDRKALLASLEPPLHAAGSAATVHNGRGPMRRLNRIEFEQNLRDLLELPYLDIRDMLPADRESHHFDKVSSTLDMSHVQLTAYLDAVETALRQAMVTTPVPPEMKKTRVVGKQLGPRRTTGGVESLFYARDGKGFDLKETNADTDKDAAPYPDIEFALFRSPGWPYAVYPKKIIASATGEYRVRFSARSVLQFEGFVLKNGTQSVPMNFRSRKPTNHDIAEDVRATGGIIDVKPEVAVYETTVYLRKGQTIEYGMLGLPVPQIDAPKPGSYRYRLDDYLVESMGQETRAFFTAMLRENLPASSIIKSDFALVNDRLARHYGLPEVNRSALRRMVLPNDSPYGGLITQGSILKVSANGTSTSPVLRGVWIMDRLIGDPPPPPPPGVPAVEPDIRGATTIRELIAQHTKSKTCSTCHAKFDPVGLALENFDIHGAWRTRYRGTNDGQRITGIDRAGHDFAFTLAANVDASGQLADGRKFENIHDMKAILSANSRQFARNLLHQFTLYATGTPVQFSDRREIESMLDACANDGYRVRDLAHALVQSSIFLGNPKP